MTFAPETATDPLAQAPADRPTSTLEDLLNQVSAIIFADQKLDQNEMEVLRDWMEEVAMRAQNGGIGAGGGAPPAEAQAAPPGPADMNQNTQDMGTVDGATPEQEY